MAGVENRLTGAAALCNEANGADQWQTSNLELGEILISELFAGSSFKQFELQISSGQASGTLSLNPLQLKPTDSELPIVFVFAVKMSSGGTLTVDIIDESSILSNSVSTALSTQQSSTTINAPGILSPEWFIFRSEPIVVDEPSGVPTISIYITFTPTDTSEKFYFTTPAVYPNYEFFSANPAVALIARRLPSIFTEIDFAADSSPDVALLRFIDVSSLGLGEAYELIKSMAYVDTSNGYIESDDSTKSILVDHDVAKLNTLLWMCKFISTRPTLRFNSSLDSETEPFILDSSELNSGDVLRLTSYTELNPPALTVLEQEILLRWQMENGYYGRNSGSLPAVVESAKLMLIGNEFVSTSFDYSAEPFVVDLQTYWYETYGAIGPEEIGNSSNLVLEAVEPARPLGTLVRHEMIG